jgi:predicted methyltransferase
MMNVINRVKGRAALLASLLLLGACATAPTTPVAPTAASFAAVVDNPIRLREDRASDPERHPAEFLAFVQAQPGMRALDVSAGGGYTAQLLALAVGPTGKVYAQTPREGAMLATRLAAHPQENLVVVVLPFEKLVPPDTPPLDLVTLIQNYHDITQMQVNRGAMLHTIFTALKPGGHFVVIDHAGRTGTGTSEGKTLHRIEKAAVIAEVQAAGFALESEGSFLRNPADPRDKTSNDSPFPTDRFALRFVKPVG